VIPPLSRIAYDREVKTIGTAEESTIDCYRRPIAAYRELHLDGSHPEISINSVDLKLVLELEFPSSTAAQIHVAAIMARASL